MSRAIGRERCETAGKILAVDMSLCNTGWAVTRLIGQPEEVVATGCIVTAPGANRKGNVAADDMRRADIITMGLLDVIELHEPDLIVAEMPFGSQSAVSAKGEGMCKGIMVALRRCQEVPCLWVLPSLGKFATCGCKDASKEHVQKIILSLWPGCFIGLKNKACEHVADALAALIAVRSSDLYMMLKTVGGGEK